MVKNLPANAGDVVSVPELGRSPEEGNGNLLQFLAWEIPWTEDYSPLRGGRGGGLSKNQTQLSD